jgi:hypothetical protein
LWSRHYYSIDKEKDPRQASGSAKGARERECKFFLK